MIECTEAVLTLEMPPLWWYHRQCWITAAAVETGDGDLSVEVRRSIRLEADNDEWYGPVARFLAEHSAALIERETVHDERYMGYEVERSLFRCPGGMVATLSGGYSK